MAHARYCRGRSRGRITVGHALVAELADALDLGSSVLRRGGSSPPERTAMSRLIVPTVGRDFCCPAPACPLGLRGVVLVEVAVVVVGRRCCGKLSATYADIGDYGPAVAGMWRLWACCCGDVAIIGLLLPPRHLQMSEVRDRMCL